MSAAATFYLVSLCLRYLSSPFCRSGEGGVLRGGLRMMSRFAILTKLNFNLSSEVLECTVAWLFNWMLAVQIDFVAAGGDCQSRVWMLHPTTSN